MAFLLGMPNLCHFNNHIHHAQVVIMLLEENNEGLGAFRHLSTQNVPFFHARIGSVYVMSLIHLAFQVPVVCRT